MYIPAMQLLQVKKNTNDSLEGAKEQVAQNIRNLEKVGEYSVA